MNVWYFGYCEECIKLKCLNSKVIFDTTMILETTKFNTLIYTQC